MTTSREDAFVLLDEERTHQDDTSTTSTMRRRWVRSGRLAPSPLRR